jgi:hypothetical protein
MHKAKVICVGYSNNRPNKRSFRNTHKSNNFLLTHADESSRVIVFTPSTKNPQLHQHMGLGDAGVYIKRSDEMEALYILQQSTDIEISRTASMELAKRILWTTPPPCLSPPAATIRRDTCFNNDRSFYICSFGGCGSKMLQAYLSHFGNTHHIHSRNPPVKLTRVGTSSHPEWFNDIQLEPIIEKQIPCNQIENIKVIFIYRDPIYAIHSRIIPRNTHRISTDHLDNISSDHWNIESVVGNMMDLWKLEDFFDNYTIKNPERNYSIHCINYDKFWNNIPMFNKLVGLPDIPDFYPVKKESDHDFVHAKELKMIYRSLINKMNTFPDMFVV